MSRTGVPSIMSSPGDPEDGSRPAEEPDHGQADGIGPMRRAGGEDAPSSGLRRAA